MSDDSRNPQALLSICVPTYNRPKELAETLRILREQIEELPEYQRELVDIYVSDNSSPDPLVQQVIHRFAAEEFDFSYHRHIKNVGPTLNFESCYRRSSAQYVFILSDDDHLTQGALGALVNCLITQKPDIVFLPINKLPADGPLLEEMSRDRFLKEISFLPTLISACVIRLPLIKNSLGKYLDTNLHHYYYFLTALDRGERFVAMRRQMLHCPYEDNAGGYDWFVTFAAELPRILSEFSPQKIGASALMKVRKDLMLRHVLRVFVKKRMTGQTFNKNFKNDSELTVFKIVARNFYRVPAFYYAFLPACLVPASLLGTIKKIVRNIKRR